MHNRPQNRVVLALSTARPARRSRGVIQFDPKTASVLSSFVCPGNSCTACRLPVLLWLCAGFVRCN